MPAANVRVPRPLVRFNTLFPGQFGVLGTSNETGLREHCTGTVFYVDPNYPGAVNNRDGTDPLSPLLSVATALTKCQAYRGDVICVMANDGWQYGSQVSYATPIAESVTVSVPGVSIIGISPSGALGPVWYPSTVGGTCIVIAATDVLVEGFCFTENPAGGGADRAIYAVWDGVTTFGDNAIVRNCFFSDGLTTGVQLEYSWNSYIQDNIFQELAGDAIYVDPAGSGARDCVISGNWFRDNVGAAMNVNGLDGSLVQNNWIWNALAHGAAAATNLGIDLTAGADNLVCNNWFSCLLPVPANGDWDDLNTGVGADNAWVGNYCEDGMAVTSPT